LKFRPAVSPAASEAGPARRRFPLMRVSFLPLEMPMSGEQPVTHEHTIEPVMRDHIEVDIDAAALRYQLGIMVEAMQKGPIKNRQRSIAITKLEEASLWLEEEIRRN
jgi:hypothetical protein